MVHTLIFPCFQSIASPSEQENNSIKCLTLCIHVSNRSRPLASRRYIFSRPRVYVGRVSNRSRPLASRRKKNSKSGSHILIRVSNRSRPLASRRQQYQRCQLRSEQFPIDRVPQRVGELAIPTVEVMLKVFPINRVPQRVGDLSNTSDN